MRELELVIFDCDGVLVDSEPISNGVLAEVLSEEGLALTGPQARAIFQGMTLEQVARRAQELLGRPPGEGWLERFIERRAECFRRELREVAGARAAVQAVSGAGVDVCVASQGRLEKTAMTLAITGLEDLFGERERFSAEQVREGKPAPDLFLFAAARMGAAPAACAVVEDTPSGVRAAVAAGMRAIGFSADSDERSLRAAGAEPLARLEQLPELLGLAVEGERCAG